MSFGALSGVLSRRRCTLGVLTTLQKDIFRSHYHACLLSGIFRRCGETGTGLKIIAFPPEGYSDLPSIFHEHSLDGLMVLTWRWIHPKIAELIEHAREERVLVVNDPLPDLGVNIVCTDVEHGMRLAVAHLARRGIRKVGMVHGPLEVPFRVDGKVRKLSFVDTRLKEKAFISALRSKKIPVKSNWIRSAEANSENEGFRVMKKWLREKSLPEAMVCGNDDLAFGVIKAIKNAGFECPEDIAVIGFDDNDRAKSFVPPLTTVRQPLAQMGEDAVDILLAQIEKPACRRGSSLGRPSGKPVRKNYPPKLIVRKSA